MADGMACRIPVPGALDAIRAGATGVVRVTEDEIKAAMRHYFTDTHNVAEGAGAAPLAALLKDRQRWQGRKVGVILSGGNVDRTVYQAVLQRSEEHTSELQSLMRISYAVFCLKKKKPRTNQNEKN